jgi:hypothetical protein
VTRRGPTKWTEAMVAELRQHVADPGKDWNAVGRALNLPEQSVRHKAMRLGINKGGRPNIIHERPAVVPRISSPVIEYETDPAELWARAEGVTARDVAKTSVERFVDIEIPDDRPIGVSFISDQHIATRGPAQLRAMRQDAEKGRETDGLYAVMGGDGPDNHIKHLAAMLAAGSKVSEQWALYDHYLGMFGPKILAMISGNHDDWTADMAGVNMVAALAKQRKIHYSPDEVVIRLSLGGQPYRLAIRHQYRMNSSFNLTHACKQWLRMGQDDWDVGVVCHHHDAAAEAFQHHGLTRWAARPGSYQVTSGYSRRYGYNHSKPTCPTFILFPGERRIMGFVDVWDASGYLTYLREGWPHTRTARPAA